MGLSVSAYKNIEFIGDSLAEKTIELYINPDFPKQGEGLIHRGVYSYKESMRGWRSSYSTYGDWREELAKLAGYEAISTNEEYARRKMSYVNGAFEKKTEGPFYELICFSDCEGVINAEHSKKLYRDFQKWEEKAEELNNSFFYEGYKKWLETFKFASNNGVVCYC